MIGTCPPFANRREAGQGLAQVVATLNLDNPLVLALPRGGVPVAFEVAKALRAQLDLLLVRKIGAPGNKEYAIGALVDGVDPQIVLNQEAIDIVRPPAGYVEAETQRQLIELERRRELYIGSHHAIAVTGRIVVLIDDGIATGSTVTAALRALRKANAAMIVLAVPVAPAEAIASLRDECDKILCLSKPTDFRAVDQHYEDFSQTTDSEVVKLLREARLWMPSVMTLRP
jgi:putative phosphoribosyl transferase